MENLTYLDSEAIKKDLVGTGDQWMRGGLYEYNQMKQENIDTGEVGKTS